jgi:hypothetical protein
MSITLGTSFMLSAKLWAVGWVLARAARGIIITYFGHEYESVVLL